MKDLLANIVYRCGCVVSLPIDLALDEAAVELRPPSDVEDQPFQLKILRISRQPSVFVEAEQERPLWAADYHYMVPFNFEGLPNANVKKFAKIFSPWNSQMGMAVPACVLPDVMRGRGRFFGLWKSQQSPEAKVRSGFRVIDGGLCNQEEEKK